MRPTGTVRFLLPILLLWGAITPFLFADPIEPNLANIKQLTFGGQNAEAYFSNDGKHLTFQSTREPYHCDQIFMMNTDGSEIHQISNGKGRTTCSYFFHGDKRILYSSTMAGSPDCPPVPDYSRGYVWAVYPDYDIYTAKPDGSDVHRLTNSPGYDAEATISPDGKKIVFTSDRDGDLELYSMDTNGDNVKRLTFSPGYDGGAFFSTDSKQIVFRGAIFADEKELAEARELLKQNLVKPGRLEIFVMDADGKNRRQITHNGAANFCPYFFPDGKRIIFASNMNDPNGRNFDLYSIGLDGNDQEQITFNPSFDAFPMFSPDGKKLVFASNRNGKVKGETNIFIADWVESPPPDAERIRLKQDLSYLASDEMKGRLTGSPEARKAAEYIASQFQAAGLKPAPGTSGFYQPFEFISGVALGDANTLSFQAGDQHAEYRVNADFVPVGFSEDGKIDPVPVIFAGFGIQAADLQYDDYADLDVKGKIVVVYRFGPEGDDPKSQYATYYPLRYKAMTAREHGAAALLVVSEDPSDDDLIHLRRDASYGTAGIPVLSVKREVVQDWLKAAGAQFPDPKNPHGEMRFELKGVAVTLQANLVRQKSSSDNVVGWLPASDPAARTIVFGAHYDHLGLGIEGSLAEKWGEVHNGADDNASGVSGLLELARKGAATSGQRNENLLFIAFGGEELGLLGSAYFVKNPLVPVKDIEAMLNMDMIGRLRENKLVVGGAGTSSAWEKILADANTGGLQLTLQQDGYGPSDHSSFYSRDIPVLFFFTGAHAQYHRPEDDTSLINFAGLESVVEYVWRVSRQIEALPSAPQFVRVKGVSQPTGGRNLRAYLGTIPDYTEEVKGVKLTGVREGGPAQLAGIQGGDVIVEFGGKTIENIYDYTYALQEHKPGDTITIVVLRDGNRLNFQVTLTKRTGE
jgi:Tol biopolymer transport system component